MNHTPYIAIDVETTGLDPIRCQLLEVAAVVDIDGKTPAEKLPRFQCIVDNKTIYGTAKALNINARIIRILSDVGNNREKREAWSVLEVEEAAFKFNEFVEGVCRRFEVDSVHPAGKNFSSFDAKFLHNNGFDTTRFKHRTIDPGSLFMPVFGYPPSTEELLAEYLPDYGEVKHRALADAMLVIELVRIAMAK